MQPPDGVDGRVIRRMSELLRQKGYTQTVVVDPTTQQPCLRWGRTTGLVHEAVLCSSEDSALAYRVWAEDFDSGRPFDLEDDLVLWKEIGPFLRVSDDLLNLDPPPGSRSHFPRAKLATKKAS